MILCNVLRESFSDNFLNVVEKYVKDLGGGFVVIGGVNFYVFGNYFNLVLEKMLFVKMEFKNKEKEKNIDVMFVFDYLGSMVDIEDVGIFKLEIVKSVFVKMVEYFESLDGVGVIVFDYNYYWVYKFGKFVRKEDVIESILSIEVGGGMVIILFLSEVVKILKKLKVKNKLVVFLIDGMGE